MSKLEYEEKIRDNLTHGCKQTSSMRLMHFNGFEDTSFSTVRERDHWIKFMIILIKHIKEKQDKC